MQASIALQETNKQTNPVTLAQIHKQWHRITVREGGHSAVPYPYDISANVYSYSAIAELKSIDHILGGWMDYVLREGDVGRVVGRCRNGEGSQSDRRGIGVKERESGAVAGGFEEIDIWQ